MWEYVVLDTVRICVKLDGGLHVPDKIQWSMPQCIVPISTRGKGRAGAVKVEVVHALLVVDDARTLHGWRHERAMSCSMCSRWVGARTKTMQAVGIVLAF